MKQGIRDVENQPYARTTNGIPSAIIFLFSRDVKLFHSNGTFEGYRYTRTFPSKRKAMIFYRMVKNDPEYKNIILDYVLISKDDDKTGKMSLDELIEDVDWI